MDDWRWRGDIQFKNVGALPGKCSGRMDWKLFRAALKEAGIRNVDDSLEWAQERGGYCDCEVVLNAILSLFTPARQIRLI